MSTHMVFTFIVLHGGHKTSHHTFSVILSIFSGRQLTGQYEF